tara:strand:+ start:419 stop:928 length:510 start_codon:yes stop_codon:yes gene_type:complete
MPKGLKQTSSPLQISANVIEAAIDTFTSTEIELPLDPLNNEVFVVTQINIDVDHPDTSSSKTSAVSTSVSTVRRTTIGSIGQSNVIGTAKRSLVVNGNGNHVPFDREDPLFAALSEDYLSIIATPNFYFQIHGENNQNPKGAAMRIYGYRARCDAAVYASLVQSELLSE